MNDIKTTRGERICFALLWVMAFVLIGLPLLFVAWFLLSPGFSQEPNRRVITDPAAEFKQSTGLNLPASASVVSANDVWLDFLGDGEFHLVFDVDHATLKQWLDEPPPWEHAEWKRGPVSEDIGWHCGFGARGMSADSTGGGPDHNISEVQVELVLTSKQVWYVAQDSAQQWEMGQILIIDPEHNRVWYSSWKF
ncbi:hypothetical protein [uncultured Gimesia sp.]|uniref:hypothetical protein n=1 Tax=uncultured Gimesia sp. TaxID=1678688 RepID=UPI002631FB58|nr:hypothetical protein [uncultured Gimesia sp.]